VKEAVVTNSAEPRTSVGGNLALLAFSIGLALLAMEIVARMMLPAPLQWLYPQTTYRADPHLIFGLLPNQHSYSADKPVVINERGLRGPVVPYERTPGKQRILFLGDSITFGYGVNDAEVVTERVGSLLGAHGVPTEIINSAVPSYNTHQEVAYLETEGYRYSPDWVIVGVCWNDIADKSAVQVDANGDLTTIGEATPESTPMSETPTGYALRNLLKRSRLVYGSLQAWRGLTEGGASNDHLVFRTNVLEGNATGDVEAGWNDMKAELQKLKRLSIEKKFRVLMVTFPIPIVFDESFPKSSYPARLQELAQAEGIATLDLTPAFRAAYHGHESLFIAYDADHPNADGHAIAAREISAYLTSAEGRGS
jgi:lysophospholipase L1-like esterase